MDAQYEMAMALRKSHCDRDGKEHECVGEVTIKRGEVCLNCPLCGTGEHIDGWDALAARQLENVFHAAGIDWNSLTLDRRVDAIRALKRI